MLPFTKNKDVYNTAEYRFPMKVGKIKILAKIFIYNSAKWLSQILLRMYPVKPL